MITQHQLKSIFHYSPETGIFTRLKSSPSKNNKESIAVGCGKSNGYIRISIKGKLYQAHRLAWLYMTGDMPYGHIDHINMNKKDNSWDNLREATKSENHKNRTAQKNNKLNLKNISKIKCGSYRVQVVSNGVCYGRSFKNINDAIDLADKLRKEHHGSFCAT